MDRQEPRFGDVSRATRLLGRVGVWSNSDHLTAPELMTFAGRVEALGFDTLWLNEVSGREPFAALGALAVTTNRVTLGLGIASVYARDSAAAHAGALTLAELSRGRFVLGLGVSHAFHVETQRGHEYLRPLPTMRAYLDAYAAAPYRAPRPAGDPPVIVAALRRQMLQLAASRADGAFPHLVLADYLARARQILDQAAMSAGVTVRPTLVVTLAAVLETDPTAARATARRWMEVYLTLPNYRNNLLECGFDEEDVAGVGSDRLVDEVVAWGSAAEIRARVDACHAVGVDHVVLIPLSGDGRQADLTVIEAVAG